MIDIFRILSIDVQASWQDVKSACQSLLLQHHPDKNHGKETDRYLEIQAVWKIVATENGFNEYLAVRTAAETVDKKPTWKTVRISDLIFRNEVGIFECRCGGEFMVDRQEVDDAEAEGASDIILDCDICSLELEVSIELPEIRPEPLDPD